jgi:hypothetical protein
MLVTTNAWWQLFVLEPIVRFVFSHGFGKGFVAYSLGLYTFSHLKRPF